MSGAISASTPFAPNVAQAVAVTVGRIGAEAICSTIRADTVVGIEITLSVVNAAHADTWVILGVTSGRRCCLFFALSVVATLYTGTDLTILARLAGAA
jgi:hypothetical protein